MNLGEGGQNWIKLARSFRLFREDLLHRCSLSSSKRYCSDLVERLATLQRLKALRTMRNLQDLVFEICRVFCVLVDVESNPQLSSRDASQRRRVTALELEIAEIREL